ncbi:MAG: amidohydrolase family protein [Clostridiales bacterium]|nr:amidohydrolase family protein [Candidatus Cacconaster stercorequi]
MFDLLIRGGTVVDGTGRPGFAADIGVLDGKIAAIDPLPGANAQRTVNATGRLVTPGFIDIHRHADAAAFRPGFGELELRQGLTTIVNGNCGLSVAPFGPAHRQEILSYLRPITGQVGDDVVTDSLSGYFAAQPAAPIHTGMLVGAGILRADAAGYELEHLEPSHYRAIHRALERALADGALGVSLGLGYAPECFYTTEELIHALAPLQGQDIPLTVHMRQEGGGVCRSAEEMIAVARALHIPLHISHLKAMGRENWNSKIPQTLRLLHRARDEGVDVTCDVYPYTAGSTQLLHILPPDFLTGGIDAVTERLKDSAVRRRLKERIESGEGFDNIAALAGWDGIYLTSLHCPEDQAYLGKNLQEISEIMGKSPLDCCCDLLVREHCQITMIDFMAAEEDIALILRDELSNVISDATYPTQGMLHPRVYGTFVHLLEHFVREMGVLSVEDAIAKMTSRPAAALRLAGKGVLCVGADADINVFALENLHETGTYTDPCRFARGMDNVIVGGQVALEGEKMTGSRAGRIIRRETKC